jgi:hypothetical protein
MIQSKTRGSAQARDLLDSFRETVCGCDLAAFGDLHSALILSVSSDNRRSREELDSLCEMTSRLFTMSGTSEAAPGTSITRAPFVVAFSARQSVFSVCANDENGEFALAVMEGPERVANLVDTLKAVAVRIAGETE